MLTELETDSTEFMRGLGSFIDAVVVPLEEANSHLLAERDGRFYADDGSYSPDVIDLIRRVRMESAAAGYYTMCCPESIGGGGLSRRAELLTHEYLAHKYGPQYLLPYETLAHWAFGPSILCESFTPELRDTLLDDLVGGRVGIALACPTGDDRVPFARR